MRLCICSDVTYFSNQKMIGITKHANISSKSVNRRKGDTCITYIDGKLQNKD